MWNFAKLCKGVTDTQAAILLITVEEISTVLAEKFGSRVEGEERSHARYAPTFFSELRIISVMALIQSAVFYCLWIYTETYQKFFA